MTSERPDLPGGAELARVIAEAGYAGTELGPPSYFGEGAALAELLAEHGLALVGSFLPLRFAYRESREEDAAILDATLTQLEAAAAGAPLPRVLLADAFREPDRMRYAGAIEEHPETWLSDARFATLVDGVHRAAERCRDRGFEAALH